MPIRFANNEALEKEIRSIDERIVRAMNSGNTDMANELSEYHHLLINMWVKDILTSEKL